jgi:VWFA-related protein
LKIATREEIILTDHPAIINSIVMFYRRVPTFIILFVFALPLIVRAQTPSQTGDQTLKIGAKEVLLDVIVRDKKGRNVRDLKAEDLEVYEDGVRQRINSFRLIESDPTAGKMVSPEAIPIDVEHPINLVTLVFDNLDNGSRKLAREAALDFVNNPALSNVLISVYVMSQRFYVLQPYTSDRAKARQAIEAATGRAETQYPNLSKQIVEQMQIIANAADFGPGPNAPPQAQANVIPAQNPQISPFAGLTPSGLGSGGTGLDKALAQITLNTFRAIEAAAIDQQARASIYTFLNVVREQRLLLGRKSLLYFSTGLVIPPNLVDVMRTTMSEANRANVSIYAIDARGLQQDGESDRASAQLAMAIKASNSAFNEGGSMASLAESFKSSEMAESSLRMNKQGTLAELAEGTGGFMIANTNDLKKPLKRIVEEISSYYELTYEPTAQELDGKFRKLSVKLARSDARLTTRNGYFAIPNVDGKAVMGYEMPMLAATNEKVLKHELPFQSGVLRFTPSANAAQHLLLMAVPLSEITFKTDKTKKLYSTHFAVLALVKNEKGEVITRVSQDYPLQGKLERLESLKKGNFDFTKAFALAPGKYNLQTVVHDFESGKTSVESRGLIVPAPAPNLAVSSLTLIKRLEASGANKPSDDKPLLTTNGRIVPNLGDVVNAEKEKAMGFYLVAYTNAKEKASLTLEFLQSGEVIAQTTMELPAPDEKGRIAHLFSVPADSFGSGEYQARAIVKQGQTQAADSVQVSILNPNPTKQIAAPAAQAMTAPAANTSEVAPVIIAPPAPPISTVGISAAVLAASKALASKSVNATAINIPELLTEVERNGRTVFQNLLGFTYQLRKVHHVLNDAGEPTKEEFQDYEAYPVRGRHVLIQIADSGKKLPEWQVEQERKRAGSELERAESDVTTELQSYLTAAISGTHRGKSAGLLIDPTAFLRASDFGDPRVEMFDGSEMIVLDFLPRIGEKLPLTKAFVGNLNGTIWIDALDKVLVRLEAKNVIPGVDKNGRPLHISPEPKLIYQQTKQPSGEWFPTVIRLNADGDASAFYGLNWDVVFEFKDYRKFNTMSDKEKIVTPEKKP